MKVIFLGTPEIGAVVLGEIDRSRHEVVCVVSQPDRATGRGNKVIFCPVKEYALAHNLPIRQYEKINDHVDELRSFGADIMVTCAYGQILKQPILDVCPHGIINVHASLLPAYRGSSPVEWALISGEKEIGVTIMQTALGVDTGDIILQRTVPLDGDENAAEALQKISLPGGQLLVESLDLIEEGRARFIPQDESKATRCRMFVKEDGKIDFTRSAEEVHNFIRGINPRPGAFFDCENGRIKVHRAAVVSSEEGRPGEIVKADPKNGLVVACGKGAVRLTSIQGENAKAMEDKAYLLGKKLTIGSIVS